MLKIELAKKNAEIDTLKSQLIAWGDKVTTLNHCLHKISQLIPVEIFGMKINK